jgi:hypothetical protein
MIRYNAMYSDNTASEQSLATGETEISASRTEVKELEFMFRTLQDLTYRSFITLHILNSGTS